VTTLPGDRDRMASKEMRSVTDVHIGQRLRQWGTLPRPAAE